MTDATPLDRLQVIDRIEVGPIHLEPRRLVAPYTVVRGADRDTAPLIYRYEEDVFQPDDPASHNLALMIAAQLALNYGLFARELVFHGRLDRHDRRLLAAMGENTAREIYVNKLLRPNPFLTGPVVGLEPRRLDRYLRADLRCDGDAAAAAEPWHGRRQRVAVLSSGGKDSLLSQGLLDELGRETHPLFVNESGRHWYTALNAHRHFRAHVPRTGRVWTTSDRLFARMLRHLPFVRGDFARVRSDEYPIRLWTVAVFSFGVLPLLRARGIGRLVIGDEHDTTVRRRHHDISHHDGLYDQSRWFDDAMSRYFARKGWGVSQFSLLRPLSELLIEKVLAERYPELQAHQVSCHAAHLVEGRVRPCGRCEKCRRIVGMLMAIGVDPSRCGYSEAQVRDALAALERDGVHQESAGADQLFHLLQRGGLIVETPAGRAARERPEVMKLRFDPTRSPLDAIPADLRAPLYRILLEHADGAVRREGRTWLAFDPLGDESLRVPYRFERASSPAAPPELAAVEGEDADAPRDHLLGELTWPQAERRLAEVDVALLPVGAIEQHGPHLPLDTDAYDAERLAREVGARCGQPRPLVLPLIPYGVSYHHEDFAGTIGIGNTTLADLVYDIGLAAARHGITKLVIVNGHGGNAPALQFAAQKINRDAHIFTCVDTGETSDVDLDELCETPNDVHAGEAETSTALATRPHLVDQARMTAFVPRFSSGYLDFTARRRVEWFARTARISPTGVLGDPTRASAAKGRAMWEVMVRNLVELVEHIKGLTLDEIYERRY